MARRAHAVLSERNIQLFMWRAMTGIRCCLDKQLRSMTRRRAASTAARTRSEDARRAFRRGVARRRLRFARRFRRRFRRAKAVFVFGNGRQTDGNRLSGDGRDAPRARALLDARRRGRARGGHDCSLVRPNEEARRGGSGEGGASGSADGAAGALVVGSSRGSIRRRRRRRRRNHASRLASLGARARGRAVRLDRDGRGDVSVSPR